MVVSPELQWLYDGSIPSAVPNQKDNIMNPLTALELFHYLASLQKSGHDLASITINFRQDANSEYEVCTSVSEDHFDAETYSILESIVFMADPSESE